ncbi:hypothetical protein N7478_002234 [Penicillium angulare]|uniref:uncharacterized protein n=1 Tax=Penicillium angulare TaxID=116970 RepID=UPI0025415B81|nr:uncharacterized protein N7478_002234 [Penicillium angulare]KAJ5289204.1 hypothetical protein N7478_002234 [Penicillium angulare]
MEHSSPTSSRPNPNPAQLLWSYERLRTNRALTTALVDAKGTYDESVELVNCLSKSLQECIIIISAITTFNNQASNPPASQDYQIVLKRLSKRALESLRAYATLPAYRSKTLSQCVAELECLCNDPDVRPSSPEPTDTEINEIIAESMWTPKPTITLTSSERDTPVKSESESTSELAGQPVTEYFPLMKQGDHSLEKYFEAVRKIYISHCKQVESNRLLPHFIQSFIYGLNEKIYRRRIIHALRKEGWTWAPFENMVEFIILEEEYFKHQDHAVQHRMEDGSVILPDGSRLDQFIELLPITEQDLTESEKEDESMEEEEES